MIMSVVKWHIVFRTACTEHVLTQRENSNSISAVVSTRLWAETETKPKPVFGRNYTKTEISVGH